MNEMAITSERIDPAAADWTRAVRLLLDHRLYAVAVRVGRLALAATPGQAENTGTLHHLLAVGLTETGQALMAADHYARALEELRLTEPGGPSTLRVQASGHGDVRPGLSARVLDVGNRGGTRRHADDSVRLPPSAG